jgi:invasion protein IalB
MEAVTLTAISSIPARLFRRFLGAVAMVTGLAALLPSPDASAATRIEKTFGSWAVICVENDDGTKRCSMVQQRAEQQTRRVVFVWSILSNEGALRQTLTVPAGVSIKEGIRLFIGDADPVTLPYETCGPRICLATMALDDAGIASISAAAKASANYVQGSKRLVQIDLDTAGFSDALAYLREQLQ